MSFILSLFTNALFCFPLSVPQMTRLSLYHNNIHRIENNAFDGLIR